MDIQFQKNDDLSAKLTITFTPEDYQTNWDNELKKQQKQLSIKGFRPGKAPLGMVKKMYGSGILVNAINELTNKTVDTYLKDNNIDILARPMEAEDQKELNFENPADFVISFDLGLAPEVNLNISEKDTVVRYKIEVEESDVDNEVKYLAERYGELKDIDTVEADSLVYAEVSELDNEGNLIDEGITNKIISFTLKTIEDEAIKAELIGKKEGEVVSLNLLSLYKNDKSMLAKTLEVSEEIADDLNPVFQVKINQIQAQQVAEINQDLFDKIFPGQNITDETAFRSQLKENLQGYFAEEAEQLFEHYLDQTLQNNHPLPLPESFLKRWLVESKEAEYNESNIEERFEQEASALRKMLVREKIAMENKIEISPEEIQDTAIAYCIGLFRQYGIPNASPEMVKDYAMKQLKEYAFVHKMNDIALRRKVTNKLKEVVTIQESEISKDDFYKKVNEQRAPELATA